MDYTLYYYFANILAVRSDLSGRPSYGEVLERVRGKVLAAWAAQDVPFHRVVGGVEVPRVAGATPVFQAMFALQEASWHSLDVDTAPVGLASNIVRVETHRSKFAVHLMLRERVDGGLDGDLLYPTALFDRSTIQRMGRHFEVLVASILSAGGLGTPIGALKLLSEEEHHMVAWTWNNTAPSPKFPSLTRIDAQVMTAAAKCPDTVAVEESEGRSLTYTRGEREI